MKKHFRNLLLLVMTNLLLPPPMWADNLSPYTVDFNSAISTTNHDFKIATGWDHITESYTVEDWEYGSTDTYWVSYSYNTTGGVNDDGCLKVGSQNIGGWGETKDVNDLLVTPTLTGEVSIMVKAQSSTTSSIKFFAIGEGKTFDKTAPLKEVSAEELSTSSYTLVSLTLDAPTQIGIRASYVYIDDFKATSADVTLSKGMEISYVFPESYWLTFEEQADGTVKFTDPSYKTDGFKIKVRNNGDLPISVGDTNFSVVYAKADGTPLGEPMAVETALAVGEESPEFVFPVRFNKTDLWGESTSSSPEIYVKENLTGTLKKIGAAQIKAYEAKFTFRDFGSYTTGSLTEAQTFGLVSTEATKQFEIYNNGTAPLQITGISIAEGFTIDPSAPLTVEPKEQKTVTVKTTTTPGVYSGNLTITYVTRDGIEAKTYTLPFSATVIREGSWSADFNGTSSTIEYPEGTVAESGIQSGYKYVSSSNYNLWLKSSNSDSYILENNKFITPKLKAEANESMTFDVAYDSDGSQHFVKVYLSTDRLNWGEPVAEISLTSDNTVFKSQSFTVGQAGEYYVGFAVFGAKLDNINGFKKVDGINHDLYETNFQIQYNKKDANGNVYNGEVEYTLSVIPVLGETKDSYTLDFCMEDPQGNIAKTAVTPINLTRSAKSSTSLKATHTSEYEQTTDVKAYFVFNFTNGSSIKTKENTFKVLVEPDFTFIKNDAYTVNRPDNEKNPIAFGKVNQPVVNTDYVIFNWGSAPLTVSSITVPDGFSVNASSATVEPKAKYPLEITFDPETTGTYSGDLEVTYIDAAGESQTFTLPISGTMLDQSKWFASFEDAKNSTTGEWPGGIVYDDGVQLYNIGSYAKPDMGAITYSDDKWFTTPALTAAAGEQFQFNAKSNSSYRQPSLKVYASATREGLRQEESRTELLVIDQLTDVLTDYTATIADAGTYFIGFQLGAYAVVADIYGLEVAEDFHDIDIISSSLAATSQMQNVATTAQLQVRNYGIAAETNYEIVVHVGDDSYTVAAPVEIPMNHTTKVDSSSDATTGIAVSLRWPETGTYPVYLEFKSGNYSKATDPVEVTFTEELPTGQAAIGTPSDFDKYLVHNYHSAETAMLFTSEELGLANGTKISGLSLKGYSTVADKATLLRVYYQFTDETTLAQPASGNYDVTDMVEAVNGRHTWSASGSKNETVDKIAVNFTEPMVYETGKSLKVLVCSYVPTDVTGFGPEIFFEVTNSNDNCYNARKDNLNRPATDNDRGGVESWSKVNRPVLYLNYVLEPTYVTGSVKNNDAAVEGAVVTLISEDGDNVRYSATTAADGTYSMKVIQNDRVYTAQAVKDNLMDIQLGITPDANEPLNFAIGTAVILDDNANIADEATGALVLVDLNREAGFNAVVFPMDLTMTEINDIFGTDAEVFEFQGMAEDDNTTAWFKPSDATSFAAGTPILIHSGSVSEKLVMRGKDIAKDVTPVVKDGVTFTGAFAPATMETGMFHVNTSNWSEYVEDTPADDASNATFYADRAATTAETIRPFTAVIKTPDNIESLSFVTSNNRPTGVENVLIDAENQEDVIYNLQGIRVKNPGTGIYIVNGKKTYLRK